MFKIARIKLTAWYLLIIMLISFSFSVVVYEGLSSELDRIVTMQKARVERRLPERMRFTPLELREDPLRGFALDPELVKETKERLKIILALVNLGILGTSAIAGYFLAGRTLKSIGETMEEQKRFIADASHELRTPLTSLKTEIEVNLRDKQMSLADARILLKSNLEEVNNLQILADDLIKLTKNENSQNGLVMAWLSPKDLINEAVRVVAQMAKKKNIALETGVDEGQIWGNKISLIELMVIFLDNAIKYSSKGTKVKIWGEKVSKGYKTSIIDQGMGVAKEDLKYIFDRFYRAEKSRSKSEIPGYGLGLSIAKQIAAKHHANIEVNSEVGGGSTFSVTFPDKSCS